MDDLYLRNAAKPTGKVGTEVLTRMNEHHKELADWAFSHVSIAHDATALDVGCGGGANLERLLNLCSQGTVLGVDYSPTSVQTSVEHNQAAVDTGRLSVQEASVDNLPFPDSSIDFVNACETVYFWPNVVHGLTEIHRVLKPKGNLLIICEMADPHDPRFAGVNYLTVYEPEELRKLVQQAGFNDTELFQQDEQFCIVASR